MLFDYFYSDPHFGHRKIIEYCDRPFKDLAHMNQEMVDRYNYVVGYNELVLWVGDCFFLSLEKSQKMLSRLNGRKALVIGNHDRSPAQMLEMGFEFVADELSLRMAGRAVNVCHYPYAEMCEYTDDRYPERRPKRVKGQALIHGHTHSQKRRIGTAVHVGVDAWDFRPAHWGKVEKLVAEAFA